MAGVEEGVDSEYDYEDFGPFLELVRLRLHYHRHGLPVGPYWTDFKGNAADDIEKLAAIAEEAVERMQKAECAEETIRDDAHTAEEIRDEKVDAAEECRDKVCLEAQELRQRVETLESESTSVLDLEAKVLAARGRTAYVRRELERCEEVQTELKRTHASELRREKEGHKAQIEVWQRRFDALPETWQERIAGKDPL